ncbi:HlyD family efflux transporter periplasmic adaptor subunit [Actinomycetospora sp. NBRC 106375]|uniref:efflux RND transporter periplasmic adaptor subunit n=1 Tax=Actinomycetospora sp. NBRC 106375 TaxID=3032207 RepID=UPI002554D222|nr:HlyD family efflux transporter periplasmic adaptor subunit [Actinomycetospora sp. NBRC 106375]
MSVGDEVRPGQVLAKIDDFNARQQLAQAEAALDGQEAAYEQALDNTAVDGAGNSVASARRVVQATEDQVDATLDADDDAIHAAEQAADQAKQGATAAQANFAQTQADCAAQGGASSYGAPRMFPPLTPPASNPNACILLPGAQSQAAQSQQAAAQAEGQVQQARSKKNLDEAAGQVQIAQARNGLVQVQNQLDATRADRPHQLDGAQAQVDGARVGVENAQRALDNTTLTAPVDGVVTAINGAVGEYTQPSSGLTPQAPGGTAAIPGAAAAGAGAAAASAGAGGGASPSRPGGQELIMLQSTSGFSVVAPFQEIDAAALRPGQPAHVTLDALPDVTIEGTVLAVSPASTDIANVINYYVTVAVARPDPRLKDGQTAQTSVITGEGTNALSVPNSAIIRQGDRTSVVVVQSDGTQVPMPFVPGLVGADRTEVRSGLVEGQQVLLTARR